MIIHASPEYGKYIVLFDPLDGSSNIDVNVSIGTIFSILQRPPGDKSTLTLSRKFSSRGRSRSRRRHLWSVDGAGLQTGNGVHMSHWSHRVAPACSREHVRMPEGGAICSVNEANSASFPVAVQVACRKWRTSTSPTYTSRYVGSLVSGLPPDAAQGRHLHVSGDDAGCEGKLRLMYKCNPMAFIAEQAGGMYGNQQPQPDPRHQP